MKTIIKTILFLSEIIGLAIAVILLIILVELL
jgi:hypothetical protein